MINEEFEMKSFLKNSERMVYLIDNNTTEIKDQLKTFKNSSINYPFNLICDYLISQIETVELENEKTLLIEKQEKVLCY